MAVDTTTATSSTASTSSTSNAASSLTALGEDYTAFLQLLTAQISNQDPLEPMDSTEFVSQLAQLSQVEQTVQTNSQLETISASLSAAAAMSGVNLIGHNVTVETAQLGLLDGTSSFSYSLDSSAASAKAVITDGTGKVVRTISGLSTTGSTLTDVTWDGLDDSGQAVADGAYNVSIVAADSSGTAIGASTYAGTSVQSVVMNDGSPLLQLGNGEAVALSSVLAIN
ncbi:flagellar hook assembly protein FlgD [Frigidibacter sp. MR17.14]|uniref:flagellar hook assembly protein FlgD n=1 Tax=Frigidibacter sp. MR17.14 TaxID=3126509 RepID=UPI003012DDC6